MGEAQSLSAIRSALGDRAIVMVGLMGCGKSAVGRRLAVKLGLPFVDADEEIEKAAGKSIEDIFADHGEPYFREGERKVLARLLRSGAQVLATGGGAFMNAETRAAIAQCGISVWLKADLALLVRRVGKRNNRPLLKTGDPEAVMQSLMDDALPRLCRGRYHRGEPRRAARDHRSRNSGAPRRNARRCAAIGGRTMSTVAKGRQATADAVRTVKVPLGERAYDVLIGPGLLARSGEIIAERLAGARCAVVTDENVARHHLPALQAALEQAGLFAGAIVLKPGEATKSFRVLEPLSERLLELGLERGDLVVALGGGVIGDLAGFAAAILRRGVRFVQIPTSLLAQVDSSVGGKTGIDTPQGKNLIGAFHQPSLVIADTATLHTLPPREMRAGYAEVAKYGLLGDAAFFAWLEQNWQAVFAFEPGPLAQAIETSVQAKAGIVARDETEQGERALLNLGHTFGHALEAWCGYSDRLLHGEAIAIGMCLAFRFSEAMGYAAAADGERVAAHFAAVGLPTRIADIPGSRSRRARAHAPDGAGQEGAPRQAHLHPGARHRRGVHRPRRAANPGQRLPRRGARAPLTFRNRNRARIVPL